MEFYVYALLDTRKPGKYNYGKYKFEYEPFYVGKGKGNRLNAHFKGAFNIENPRYDSFKCIKIRNIKRKTKELPKSTIIVDNLNEVDAYDLEIKLIALIGRYEYSEGPLSNATDGGEGAVGVTYTDEWVEMQAARTRETWMDPKVREERIEGLRRAARKKTPEERRNQTQSATDRLAKIRPLIEGEIKDSIKEGLANRTDEEKEAQYAKRVKTIFDNPENRKKFGEAISNGWSNRSIEDKEEFSNLKSKQTKEYLNSLTDAERKAWWDVRTEARLRIAESLTDEQRAERKQINSNGAKTMHANRSKAKNKQVAANISLGKQNSDKKEIDGAKKSCVNGSLKMLLADGIITQSIYDKEYKIVHTAIEKYYAQPDYELRSSEEWSDNLRKRLCLKYGNKELQNAVRKMKVTEIKAYLTELRYIRLDKVKVKQPVDPRVKHISTTHTAIGRLFDQLVVDGIIKSTLRSKLESIEIKEASAYFKDIDNLSVMPKDYALGVRSKLILKYGCAKIKRCLKEGGFNSAVQIYDWMNRIRNSKQCKASQLNITDYINTL